LKPSEPTIQSVNIDGNMKGKLWPRTDHKCYYS